MNKIAKKIATVLLASVFMLTGCGGAGASGDKTPDKDAKKETKVGFIYVGPVGDGGYTYAHDQGRLYLEKELGVKTVIKESVKEEKSDVQKTAEAMIEEGCNIIVGTSFGFQEGLLAVAKKYPDVKFLHCSGFEVAENMGQYFGRIHEMQYLNGVIAGLTTKTNKLGFVGAFPIPEVIRNINAYTLGARSVNPDVTVKVNWTSTWYDPAKEKEAAKALLDAGADVIGQHQDTAGPQQAAEEKGVFATGYNTDMSKVAPKANLSSAVWNWGPYYVKSVKAIQDGTWKSEKYWGGIHDDIVDITITNLVSAENKAKIETIKKDIKDGKNKIFQGPIKDQKGVEKLKTGEVMSDEDVWNINWFVEGVDGTIPSN
ncbi:MAG: BMP family ABC transporter substrate-binding protein [Clostridium sp.]|uniref:BMP family ABC transporter substrate-binding protein n=1 Tax=Clostridium sp. TaxID=1506 RepID=UPI00303A5C0E